MITKRFYTYLGTAAALALAVAACKTPELAVRTERRALPAAYVGTTDSANTAQGPGRRFFTDPALTALLDSALRRNQELSIAQQEIEIARQEVRARTGEYLPRVGLGAVAGVEKTGRYTIRGATEESVDIRPETRTPTLLPDFQVGAFASWEVDIWHRLRNARKAAALRYLASVEGRNFTVTNLVAEIASAYYELLALDNQLAFIRQTLVVQGNALKGVRMQKEAARVTELAVRRFEAQVHHTQAIEFTIRQRITETENRLNFLAGRYPQPVVRNAAAFNELVPNAVQTGLPGQLLLNRPDVRQAEQNLAAAKLDVQVARTNFYPSLRLTAGLGTAAFRPGLLAAVPESMLLTLAGDVAAPLINKNGIKALYYSANARQTQAVVNYERTVLNAYVEVSNELAGIENYQKSYAEKAREVQALDESSTISSSLFASARADYTEVLITQRDALEAKFDLTENKMQQFHATVNLYRALGGGWR